MEAQRSEHVIDTHRMDTDEKEDEKNRIDLTLISALHGYRIAHQIYCTDSEACP